MKKWILTSPETILWILLSTVAIYITIIILTRIFGKRSFSKMSSFDFACTIAIGSIIASTLLTSSVTLIEGFFGLLGIYLLQGLTAYLRLSKKVREIVDNNPLMLMKGSEILHENLKTAKVTEDDLKAKLREANVIDLKNVKCVVFETTGDISVLHDDGTKQIDPWLISGVDQ